MKRETKWTIRVFGVSFNAGTRQEKPLEEFTPQELQRIADKRNREALQAAGYTAAEPQKIAAAM
ncbi:hypothetical protein [Anaerotignum sp.]|jgi:hypothetical protein|uniref:hypothetical protein n=1 Tax=Anaerotignum sp. TaxID=2039241 RepID=UPI003AB3463D